MLAEYFERERAAGRALVAAIVIGTEGSTYRKPGALMLFGRGGERRGLLSGGCLEADLRERALRLLTAAGTVPRLEVASYDSRGSDDPVWGLGLGCEGLMRIALLRVDAASGYEPLAYAFAREARRESGAWALALGESAPAGRCWHAGMSAGDALDATAIEACRERARRGGAGLQRLGNVDIFTTAIERAPALLVCGAGPDAEPVRRLGGPARLARRRSSITALHTSMLPRFPRARVAAARCRGTG
ncbi:MAG: XdhC family protein [Steroidobacteraceae bacterium]